MWNTVAVEMLMRFVCFEMLGIGRMGLRGRLGRRMVKEEKLRMLVWLDVLVTRRVLVRETGEELVFQRMGLEPRPGLGESRADPPPPETARSVPRREKSIGAVASRRNSWRRAIAAPSGSPALFAGPRPDWLGLPAGGSALVSPSPMVSAPSPMR